MSRAIALDAPMDIPSIHEFNHSSQIVDDITFIYQQPEMRLSLLKFLSSRPKGQRHR